MDGVLLIDKPAGPTSHDVVARLRAVTGERSVGHTGTLDPQATGLLPLVLGKATRLASLLTGSDKTYEAEIRLGFATDTDDAAGTPEHAPMAELPDTETIEHALDAFRGSFQQIPPSHSAKKIGGRKAYDLARQAVAVELKPVEVTVRELSLVAHTGDRVHLTVTATAGFYVRALARDLGRRLGCGAHLSALRRTRSGPFDVASALRLEEAERLGPDVALRLIPPSEALPDLAAVRVTDAGLRRAAHGNPIGPEHVEGRWVPGAATAGPVKVLDGSGRLVALAHARGGALHPIAVLG
jgi:tRNA pseudouridine55 synthase